MSIRWTRRPAPATSPCEFQKLSEPELSLETGSGEFQVDFPVQ
jgi:hypothetical protein